MHVWWVVVVVGIGSWVSLCRSSSLPRSEARLHASSAGLAANWGAPCNPRCFETGQASGPCFLLFSGAKNRDSVRSREPEELNLLPSPQATPCRPTGDHCGCHHLAELTTRSPPVALAHDVMSLLPSTVAVHSLSTSCPHMQPVCMSHLSRPLVCPPTRKQPVSHFELALPPSPTLQGKRAGTDAGGTRCPRDGVEISTG